MKLSNPNIHAKYGELVLGLSIKNRWSILYWTFDLFRRVLLAYTLVFWNDQLWIQTVALQSTTLSFMVIICFIRARISRYDRMIDIFNQAKLLLLLYHIIVFSSLVGDP